MGPLLGLQREPDPRAVRRLGEDDLQKLGVTRGTVGVDRVSWVLLEAFRSAMPDIEFVNAEEALLFERIVKNEEERKLMRKAAWVASEGVQAGLEALAPGVTEYEVYGAFMGRMYALGSEGDGFYFLTSGPVTEEPSTRRTECSRRATRSSWTWGPSSRATTATACGRASSASRRPVQGALPGQLRGDVCGHRAIRPASISEVDAAVRRWRRATATWTTASTPAMASG